jgi:hypothetical protein
MCVVLGTALLSATSLQQPFNIMEYQKELNKFKEASDNLTNEAYYNTSWFKHKKTGEIKKFTTLTNLEKNVFYIQQAEKITIEFTKTQQKWEKELENHDETSDMGKLLLELVILRKAHALKYEQMLDLMFKKFPDDFTEEEKQFISNRVKKYHDDNKLIRRD